MTTPKRYEEMALGVFNNLTVSHRQRGAVVNFETCERDKATIARALRTAAREAQVRVLDAIEKEMPLERWCWERLFDEIRARLDSGEDL